MGKTSARHLPIWMACILFFCVCSLELHPWVENLHHFLQSSIGQGIEQQQLSEIFDSDTHADDCGFPELATRNPIRFLVTGHWVVALRLSSHSLSLPTPPPKI
jgi:hypothetical protein